jgi:hypothetical protein
MPFLKFLRQTAVLRTKKIPPNVPDVASSPVSKIGAESPCECKNVAVCLIFTFLWPYINESEVMCIILVKDKEQLQFVR